MSVTTTIQAIISLFDADLTLAADVAGTGGLWVGGIPEDKDTLPLVCLVPHDEVPEWNFEDQVVEETGRFDFVVFARGPDPTAAELVASHVKAVFDPASTRGTGFTRLTPLLQGGTATEAWVERQGYQVALVGYRAADSTWVYQVTLPYKSFVARLI